MAHASASDVRRLLARRSDGAVRLLSELVAASSPLGTSGLEAQLVVARYLQEAGYATIQALLLSRGYEQYHRQPFIFHRTVNVSPRPLLAMTTFVIVKNP